jgi:two-component system sensor histidine kinase BaeS
MKMRSLRQRLLLSHLLPILVIIPLAGVAFVYILNTQVLLASHTSDLTSQAVLIAEFTTFNPVVWMDAGEAQRFSERMAELLPSEVLLFDSGGHLIGVSNPSDKQLLNQAFELPGLADALDGDVGVGLSDLLNPKNDTAIVFVPVFSSTQRVIGVVGLTERFSGVYERFHNLRSIIIGVLIAILVLGAGIGLVLALNIERPLRKVTEAVRQLSDGHTLELLPGTGPEEVRLLQQAFNTLVERLRHVEETRRQLLANLVHELSRPMGALLSAIQALQRGADSDPLLQQEMLQGMEVEIRRLQRLTDDLTHMHEQLLGTLELKRNSIQINNWLTQALAPWREMAADRELQWEVDIPPHLPPLQADSDRLTQALGNLINNAILYTPRGGTVTITAGIQDQELWLRVSDTGPGIAQQDQSQIFKPFYRGVTAKRFPRGMGLGLSISREIALAHQGHIEFESTPGTGSSFTIWIPLASANLST